MYISTTFVFACLASQVETVTRILVALTRASFSTAQDESLRPAKYSNDQQRKTKPFQRRLRLSPPTGDLKLSLPCTLRTRDRCSRSCCSSILACDPPGRCECLVSCGELSSTTTLSPESRFALRLRRCCRFDKRCVSVVSSGRVVVGVVSVRVSAKLC